MAIEKRFFESTEISVELRDDEPTKLAGIAPPWMSLSHDLGGFREQFSPDAFDDVLIRADDDARGPADVLGLFNHDDSQILARTSANTLKLTKSERGLEFEMTELPNTQTARDVVELVKNRLLSGASFAFSVNEDGESWSHDDDGNAIRTINSAKLYEVSIVSRPAYPDSEAGLRSLRKWQEETKQLTA